MMVFRSAFAPSVSKAFFDTLGANAIFQSIKWQKLAGMLRSIGCHSVPTMGYKGGRVRSRRNWAVMF